MITGLKNKLEELRKRSAAGISRFRGASFLSFLLFFLVLYRVIRVSAVSDFMELFPESVLYMAAALATTMLFAVLWKILLEWKGKTGFALELINIPVLAGVYFLWKMMPMTAYFSMYKAGIIFSIPIFCVYFLWSEKGRGLFPHIFASLWKAAGISLLAALLGGICLAAIDSLIVNVYGGWWYVLAAFYWVLGFNLFLSYLPKRDEKSESNTLLFLLQRVLMPAYVIILGVLYIYIGKIIWTGTMPVGTMNWYASFAVAVYCLFYFCLHEEENKRSCLFLRYGAAAMLPVMAVQAWGIYIRFDAYGLTTARYASMICNAFGLLTILSALLGKSGKHLFLAAGIIVLLCSLTPLNIIDVPAKDQGHRLEKILEKYDMVKDGKVTIPSDMTEQDKKDLKSAYHYLSYDPGRWRYPAVEMINKDKELMPFFFSYREEDDHLDLYHAWSMIPAAGYERMYIFDITTNKAADGDIFTFPTENGNQEIPLAPYIENLRNLSPNSSDNVKDRLIYRLDENRIIYFVHVRIPKERDGNYYRLQGYIFEK